MDNHNNQSRVDKFAKRRKNAKLLSIMLVLGGALLLFLVVTLFFGGSDTEKADEKTPSDHAAMDGSADEGDDTTTEDDEQDEDQNNEDEDDNDDEDDEEDTDNDDVEKEKIDNPDDDNVAEAYKGDWKPIGTDQEGDEHTMNFDDGTQDRIEMEEAARVGAELDEGNMITWRVENGGDQKVIATVSAEDDPQTFRVYLNWVDDKGWKPTKVEELKENDKK